MKNDFTKFDVLFWFAWVALLLYVNY